MIPPPTRLHLFGQGCKGGVGGNLVENGLHEFLHTAALGVVGGRNHRHPVLFEQQLGLLVSLLRFGVVDTNRVASAVAHQTHAGDVGCSVANVDHVLEGHGALRVGHEGIYQVRVAHAIDALVDFVDKLRLVGVVDSHGGPIGVAIVVVEEFAGVDFLEFARNGSALDNLF